MMASDLTRNQQLVLEALQNARSPMTAYNLLDALRDEGFRAPPQVYRALEKLQGLDLIHRVESLNAFIVCRHTHGDTHTSATTAFAICNSCGDAFELADDEIAPQVADLNRLKGFVARTTNIEIRGECRKCLGVL